MPITDNILVCVLSDQLLEERGDEQFNKIKNNSNHTLHNTAPSSTVNGVPALYDLRDRTHNRQLPAHQGHLLDCNFITAQSKATGNSRSGIPGNSRESATSKIPDGNSRELLSFRR